MTNFKAIILLITICCAKLSSQFINPSEIDNQKNLNDLEAENRIDNFVKEIRTSHLESPPSAPRLFNFFDRTVENIPPDEPPPDDILVPASSCASCDSLKLKISEDELTLLRIEYIKNQILKKLKLNEKPVISNSSIPRPVVEGLTMQQTYDENENIDRYEEFYAKTTQRYIFPSEKFDCKNSQNNSVEKCFKYILANDDEVLVTLAELSFTNPDFDEHRKSQFRKETFIVSELNHEGNDIEALEVREYQDAGRVKVDLNPFLTRWMRSTTVTEHYIQITCSSCDENSRERFQEDTPYIILETSQKKQRKRQKRAINCVDDIKDCCREKLYVSFRDIGWDDWIIHPSGYDAYFCRGSCSSTASLTMNGSHHATVLTVSYYLNQIFIITIFL